MLTLCQNAIAISEKMHLFFEIISLKIFQFLLSLKSFEQEQKKMGENENRKTRKNKKK